MLRIEVNEVQEALDPFFADGLISEVVSLVRKGKEAAVYLCRGTETSGRELFAAKIYRPLEHRGFRNDADYQPGRERALRRRDRLAQEKKTHHGRAVQYGVWMRSEFETLRLLHGAGADVPEPIAQSGSAILMEFIGEGGRPAPMLSRVEMTPEESQICLKRIIDNIALWLSHDRVHGDLSAYNILYRSGEVVVIDFPQAVDPRFNLNARGLLERDLENICGHFARSGLRPNPQRITHELWERYRFSEW